MRGKEEVARLWFDSHCGKGGGARDEPVDDDGDAEGGARQDHSGKAGDLKAAYLGQHVDAVGGVRTIEREGTLDHGDLVSAPLLGDARAPSRHLHGRQAGEGAHDGARRRGISDAHLAGADQVEPLAALGLDQSQARLDGRHRLATGHGGALGHVGGSRGDAEREQRGMSGQRRRHAKIGHDHLGSSVTGEHVDGGPAAKEVLDHLRGDDLGISAHSLGDHAVVGREGEDYGPPDLGWESAGNRGQPLCQLFKATQAASRLGQLVEGLRRLDARGADGRGDTIKELEKSRHANPSQVKRF